jgi:transcriptional regulator GlxA family with amidase domain
MDHGDAVVLKLQEWLKTHYMAANPVEEMVRIAGMPRRSIERRFSRATGLSPLGYVQAQRIEEAKRRLERTDMPADAISAEVGYDNAAFFRRVFKRATRLTPGAYRRKFQMGRQDNSASFAATSRR